MGSGAVHDGRKRVSGCRRADGRVGSSGLALAPDVNHPSGRDKWNSARVMSKKPKKYAEKRLARPEEGPYSPIHFHATTSGMRVCTLCANGLLPV